MSRNIIINIIIAQTACLSVIKREKIKNSYQNKLRCQTWKPIILCVYAVKYLPMPVTKKKREKILICTFFGKKRLYLRRRVVELPLWPHILNPSRAVAALGSCWPGAEKPLENGHNKEHRDENGSGNKPKRHRIHRIVKATQMIFTLHTTTHCWCHTWHWICWFNCIYSTTNPPHIAKLHKTLIFSLFLLHQQIKMNT